jgi:hypothetical protein
MKTVLDGRWRKCIKTNKNYIKFEGMEDGWNWYHCEDFKESKTNPEESFLQNEKYYKYNAEVPTDFSKFDQKFKKVMDGKWYKCIGFDIDCRYIIFKDIFTGEEYDFCWEKDYDWENWEKSEEAPIYVAYLETSFKEKLQKIYYKNNKDYSEYLKNDIITLLEKAAKDGCGEIEIILRDEWDITIIDNLKIWLDKEDIYWSIKYDDYDTFVDLEIIFLEDTNYKYIIDAGRYERFKENNSIIPDCFCNKEIIIK